MTDPTSAQIEKVRQAIASAEQSKSIGHYIAAAGFFHSAAALYDLINDKERAQSARLDEADCLEKSRLPHPLRRVTDKEAK